MKKRVTGLGGVFFKSKDPAKMREWYSRHLGVPHMRSYGGTFEWRDFDDPEEKGHTAWGVMDKDSQYYNPSKATFMINYRVENLEELLKVLKEEGVEIVGEVESFDYGKFGWILDPDGNKIELWEPNDEVYHKLVHEPSD